MLIINLIKRYIQKRHEQKKINDLQQLLAYVQWQKQEIAHRNMLIAVANQQLAQNKAALENKIALLEINN